MTRVLIVGAGSIGSRHARNLASAGATLTVTDPEPGRAASLGIGTATQRPLDTELAGDYDAVMLATPTVLHATQLEAALASDAVVFVEKPMVSTQEELEVVTGHEHRIMVGCNLRFHQPLRRVHDLLRAGVAGPAVGARFWFGSWLPDWRPHTDYRDGYSARADLGGGILMDAIHELDLVMWYFGDDLDVVGAVVDRLGPLDIDVEDTVRAILRRRSDGLPIEIALDLLSRRYRRGVEIIGTESTIRFDWDRNCIEIDRPEGRESITPTSALDDAYVAQDLWFLEWVRGGPPPPVDGAIGAAAVRLATSIRDAS